MRAALVSDERKFRLAATNVLTRNQAAALGAATANAIVRHVTDLDELAALLAELRRIFGDNEPRTVEGNTIQ